MCETCGCGAPGSAPHAHAPGGGGHTHGVEVDWGADLLEENRRIAEENRRRFRAAKTAVVNMLGSPGAGKTTLLAATLDRLAARRRIGVVTGDQVGDEDRRRLVRPGVAVRQVETGRVCHLDAHMLAHAAEEIGAFSGGLDLLLVENVGNLVCPALFDLGESRRAVVLSVAEGDDKPSKYPEIFRSADAVVISKIDLAPHVRFDRARAERDLRRLRSTVDLLPLSASNGEGLSAWTEWLERIAS